MNTFLKIEFGNTCDLGQTHYSNGFLNRLYLPLVDLQFPEYKVTDEDEKDGNEKDQNTYRMIEKIYTVQCAIPEYLLDSITTLPLCDNVVFTSLDNRSFRAENISIESEWLKGDCYAYVTIKFTADRVLQNWCCNNMVSDCPLPTPIISMNTDGDRVYLITASNVPDNCFVYVLETNTATITIIESSIFKDIGFTHTDTDFTPFAYALYYVNIGCTSDISNVIEVFFTNKLLNPGYESHTGDNFDNWSESSANITADTTNQLAGLVCCKITHVSALEFVSQTFTIADAGYYAIVTHIHRVVGTAGIRLSKTGPPTTYLQADGSFTTSTYYFSVDSSTSYVETIIYFYALAGTYGLQLSESTGVLGVHGPTYLDEIYVYDMTPR